MEPSSETEDISAMKRCSGDEYTVGYGRPPVGTRFKKGQSGNPKGRPRGKKNLKMLLDQALSEKITVNENGRRKMISKAQAGMKHLVNRVASGDAKIALKLFEIYDRDARQLKEIARGLEWSCC
ncbi:MAG TPA: DUF5681 domain-containing protein [Candidatus Sulfotelmatobacter sp.]|jgi:hypothetical protein